MNDLRSRLDFEIMRRFHSKKKKKIGRPRRLLLGRKSVRGFAHRLPSDKLLGQSVPHHRALPGPERPPRQPRRGGATPHLQFSRGRN
jgi:hypothetical protein